MNRKYLPSEPKSEAFVSFVESLDESQWNQLVENVPEDQLHPLLMIECPRLLFPFAREIIATAVRDGGVPPLMLDPVDFVGLYRQNMERAQQQAQVKPS